MKHQYRYLIIGGGLAGASAIEGIRRLDKTGSIGLLSAEEEVPYNRPPLSKDLLWGKKVFNEISIFGAAYYRRQKVEVHLKTIVKKIHAEDRFVAATDGRNFGYCQLLIATGGRPREFQQAGKTVHYFRNAQDYLTLAKAIPNVEDFLIVGGGFIGAELSAGLIHLGKRVSMLLKGKYLLEKIFPSDLSAFVTDLYRQKGVSFITEDEPAQFESWENRVKVTTKGGKELEAGWVIAGIGIDPETELAKSAGLQTDNGIAVDRYLQTSRPEIFAAGDLARFPCEAIGENIRLEHWDNARAQGKCAGTNMAGGVEPYVYLPFFYSDLFDLGFEAVGKLDSKMKTISAWEVPFRKGVVVYLEDQKVKGVLLWNRSKMLDWARKLITEQATPDTVEDLKKLLPASSTVGPKGTLKPKPVFARNV
jgi:NADPH-dependent 2,4-dienoyl-CoA reductase/sulfur reductase-like enzyme